MSHVCLVHTVASLPVIFAELLAERLPGVAVEHVVDESMLADTVAEGMLPGTRRRLLDHVLAAERAGARAVLVTCSSLGEVAEQVRPFVSVPVFRVDQPMAAQAVAAGTRIGVLATLASTLEPTGRLIEREAAGQGRQVRLEVSICAGAFDALRAGRRDEHDAIIATEATRLAGHVDVLVLAQASMARVVGSLPPGRLPVPVLTSTRSGVEQLSD